MGSYLIVLFNMILIEECSGQVIKYNGSYLIVLFNMILIEEYSGQVIKYNGFIFNSVV